MIGYEDVFASKIVDSDDILAFFYDLGIAEGLQRAFVEPVEPEDALPHHTDHVVVLSHDSYVFCIFTYSLFVYCNKQKKINSFIKFQKY